MNSLSLQSCAEIYSYASSRENTGCKSSNRNNEKIGEDTDMAAKVSRGNTKKTFSHETPIDKFILSSSGIHAANQAARKYKEYVLRVEEVWRRL